MRKFFAFAAIFMLLSVSFALAQRTTGMIEGAIQDTEGTPLPGVTVTIRGLAGERSLATDMNGVFRFPALPPGEYIVTATLAGFKTFIQEEVIVTLEGIVKLSITMEMGAIEEEVTIIGESPIVDMTTSRLTTNVKKDYFDSLPKGRSYQDMAYIAPSVQSDPWGIAMSGATGAENLYIIDGINTTDVEHGTIGTNLVYEFIEEVQTKTGGYEAEFGGAMGGVVNVITKSGSNVFHGGMVFNYQNDSFYGTPEIGIFGDGAIDKFNYYDFGLSISGPLVRDRVFFFLGATPSFRTTKYTPTDSWTGESETFPVKRNRYYFSGKFTVNVAPGQTLTLSAFGDPVKGEGENPGTLRDFDTWNQYAIIDYSGGSYNFALKYDGIFGDNWLVHMLGGLYRDVTREIPSSLDTPAIYLQQGYIGAPHGYAYGGRGWYADPDKYSRWQGAIDLTFFSGSHALKGGFQYYNARSLREDYYTGGYYRIVRPAYGYWYDRWRRTEGESYTTIAAFYLQDSWRVTDTFTLNLGVRIEDQNVHACDKAIFFEPNESVIHWGFFEQVSPRLGFTWDVIGDGTSKLFGSYGRFFEMVPLDINTRQFGAEIDGLWYYDISIGDPLTYVPDKSEAFFVLEIGHEASKFPEPDKANKGLEAQFLEEFIIGYEQQFGTDLALSIRGVWKRLGQVVEDGSFDGGSTYFLFNPGRQFVEGEINELTGKPRELYIDAFPEAKRDYKALEIMLHKRFSHHYQLTMSYTYVQLRGNHPGLAWEEYGQLDPNITALFDFPEFLYNADGILPGDYPHQFKFDGVYMVPSSSFLRGLHAGLSIRARSGKSQSLIGYNQWYGPVATLTKRGSEGRLPMYWQADLHLGYDFPIPGKVKFRLTLDIFNLFNTKIEVRRDMRYLRNIYFGTPDTLMPWDFSLSAYPEPDNDYYGKGIEYQTPFRMRLGFEIRF
jgi:hypothetical protein